MRASWRELVGEALARRVVPCGFDGGTLRLRPDDPRWQKAASEIAIELTEKIRRVVPEAGVVSIEVMPASRPIGRGR